MFCFAVVDCELEAFCVVVVAVVFCGVVFCFAVVDWLLLLLLLLVLLLLLLVVVDGVTGAAVE